MKQCNIILKPHPNKAYAHAVCNTYKEHQILWKLFNDDPNAKRDFIYRYQPQSNGRSAYYIVSKRQPVDKEYLWEIQSKNYAPVLVEGQRFAFILRINPVITVKGKRHDVVMHRKHQMDYKKLVEENKPHSSTQQIAEEEGEKWLASRAQRAGFALESIRIDAYEPRTTGKKRGNKAIRYSSMDLQGILTLTDSETFEKTLMQGIGKAKAFGCGLMLIRKV